MRCAGLLIAACALMAQPASSETGDHAAWPHPASHREGRVPVGGGVAIQWIEWSAGGPATPVVFLTGLATSPHLFDQLAPKVADRRRVVGLGRRGLAPSSDPAAGYDVDTLVRDVVAGMDGLGIRRAVVVGWSIAGMEMSRLAELHPDRIAGLVYLDAAYQYRDIAGIWSRDPIDPSPKAADNVSLEASRRWFERTFGFWGAAVEADARAVNLRADGTMAPDPLRPEVSKALVDAMVAFRPRYSEIRAPVLAFYAAPFLHPLRRAAATSAIRRAGDVHWRDEHLPLLRREIARLRAARPDARVVELRTGHLCFVEPEDERRVVAGLRRFLRKIESGVKK